MDSVTNAEAPALLPLFVLYGVHRRPIANSSQIWNGGGIQVSPVDAVDSTYRLIDFEETAGMAALIKGGESEQVEIKLSDKQKETLAEILEGQLQEDKSMIEMSSSDDEGGNLDEPVADVGEGQGHKTVLAGADRRLGGHGGGKEPGARTHRGPKSNQDKRAATEKKIDEAVNLGARPTILIVL